MEMLQLRYFLESANYESFAKTADKYKVPATSVSASVKRLEKELGCLLFTRTANKIKLNDNGKRLMISVNKVFQELDQVVSDITSLSTDVREIKILVRAMRGEITDHIIEYKTKHPHICFKTVFDFEDEDFDSYDIIIDEKTDKYPKYEKINLYYTKIRLRVSSKNPLCNKNLHLSQLSHMPFISIGENSSLNKIFINACTRAGFTPNFVVKSNDVLCNRKCVEAGVGIGIGREYQNMPQQGDIKHLDVIDFNEEQVICCYYKKKSAYGNVKHFIEFLQRRTVLNGNLI